MWMLVACGGAQPTIEHPVELGHVEPTGLRVVSIPRATPGLVRLSLWIDAGTRDANPSQLATISAWSAAKAAGADVHARALPDAIELWIECAADDTARAIAQLARGLAARDVSTEALHVLQEELAEQRAQRQVSGRHLAEQHAITAALGTDSAVTLMPLGLGEQDPEITAGRVAGFLADHFGPARALLVAVGDVRASELSAAIGANLSALPRARATRSTRALDLPGGDVVIHVDRAVEDWSAIAVAGHDRDAVVHVLEAITQRWSARTPDARWIGIRGGALAIIAAKTQEPTLAIREAFDAIARANETAHEAGDRRATTRVREDLTSLSEQAGLAFCAPPTTLEQPSMHVGVAVTLADAAREGPESDRRQQARTDATERDIRRAIEETSRAPTYRGEVGHQAAQVVLANGARIVVQQRRSHQVGIALRFLGGARDEHPSTHGRTALLALLSAQACEGLGAGALSARLQALGATLTPTLDADSFGLQLAAPSAHWRAGMELITRCALRPLLNRRVLRDAQARMLTTLAPQALHGRSARVAERLVPSHPGAIAPWGGGSSALLDLDAVVRAHQESAVGARIALSIVGDVPVSDAVAMAARRVAQQPAGALPHTTTLLRDQPTVESWATTNDVPTAVIAFRIDGQNLDPTGARVFAAMLAEALIRTPSIQLTWLDAGAWAQGAWAAVGIQLPLVALETLNDTLDNAVATLVSANGRTRAAEVIVHARRQAIRDLSETANEADRLAWRALSGTSPDHGAQRAERTFDTFVQTRPHYLVSRGRAATRANNAAERRP